MEPSPPTSPTITSPSPLAPGTQLVSTAEQLIAAVSLSPSGSNLSLAVPSDCTLSLGGRTVEVNDSVSLMLEGGSQSQIDGGYMARLFTVQEGASLVLRQLQLARGMGGALRTFGHCELEHVLLCDCKAQASRGQSHAISWS